MNDSIIIRFSDVTFEYSHNKLTLDEASFSVRNGSRITLMGQNGAGKSTLFKLITREIKPTSGDIFLTPKDASIAIARQVMPRDMAELTVREYFATAFQEIKYNLDKLIKDVFAVVNVDLMLDKKIKEFSGGQQARLLLAHALIQEPDILLLDEPTNNLDQSGIEHLTGFLMMYEKTVIVISHDANFLNAFSDGVLYLDVHTHKVEQYSGNYYDVVEEIGKRIERENAQNARMQKEIKENRTQAEVFAHKGGKLRAVAKRMREAAEEAEENIVDVRQEDKTIREFTIPRQEYDKFSDGKILEFSSISAVKEGHMVNKDFSFIVRKNTHVLISGPNGIGKSTLLEKIANADNLSLQKRAANESHSDEYKGDKAGYPKKGSPRSSDDAFGARNDSETGQGFTIGKNIKIGYYKQDFSNFDFNEKAFDALKGVMEKFDEHVLRSTAAGFLLDGKLLDQPITALSEGQKGLLAFCRLVLMKPGLLILDEPTNHINFRHLPIIAQALNEYQGGMILVSHIPDFVKQIRIDQEIDLSGI